MPFQVSLPPRPVLLTILWDVFDRELYRVEVSHGTVVFAEMIFIGVCIISTYT